MVSTDSLCHTPLSDKFLHDKFQHGKTPEKIYSIFEREAVLTLGMTDVFSRDYVYSQLLAAEKNPTLNSISDGKIDFNLLEESMKVFSDISSGRGVDFAGRFAKPFSVAFQPSFFSTMMIFTAIRSNNWLDTELITSFIHSKDLYDKVSQSEIEPDVLLLSLPTAIKEGCFSEYSGIEYFPLCIMPQSTHQVIAPRQSRLRKKSAGYCQYHFQLDYPGSAAVYFDELISNQSVKLPMVKLNNSAPYNLKDILEAGDYSDRAISWFPHYGLYVNYHNCLVVDEIKNNIAHQGSVLFLHNRYQSAEMPLSLCRIIKSAWSGLLADENIFKFTLDLALSDENYAKTVFGAAGMYTV